MSYIKKLIFVFVLMFGVFSAPYAAAGMCTSLEAHIASVDATCKGNGAGTNGWSNNTAMGGTCDLFATSISAKTIALCKELNYGMGNRYQDNWSSAGKYCPDGANGNPCACAKGKNWQSKSGQCVTSR
jgi:hypothetical protein